MILLRLISIDPILCPKGRERHLPAKLKRVPKRLLHVGRTRAGIFIRRSKRTRRAASGPTFAVICRAVICAGEGLDSSSCGTRDNGRDHRRATIILVDPRFPPPDGFSFQGSWKCGDPSACGILLVGVTGSSNVVVHGRDEQAISRVVGKAGRFRYCRGF